jgi:hypothetical protein
MTVSTVDRSEQRLVLVLLALLTVVLAYAMAGAFGASVTGTLHWTGVVLLVAGIGLAVKGSYDIQERVVRLLRIGRGGQAAAVSESRTEVFVTTDPSTVRVSLESLLGGSPEDRVEWPETQVDGSEQLAEPDAWRQVEARQREEVVWAGQQPGGSAELADRASMANLAVGGLRLQTWGLICLVAGTILTAFW